MVECTDFFFPSFHIWLVRLVLLTFLLCMHVKKKNQLNHKIFSVQRYSKCSYLDMKNKQSRSYLTGLQLSSGVRIHNLSFKLFPDCRLSGNTTNKASSEFRLSSFFANIKFIQALFEPELFVRRKGTSFLDYLH